MPVPILSGPTAYRRGDDWQLDTPGVRWMGYPVARFRRDRRPARRHAVDRQLRRATLWAA